MRKAPRRRTTRKRGLSRKGPTVLVFTKKKGKKKKGGTKEYAKRGPVKGEPNKVWARIPRRGKKNV